MRKMVILADICVRRQGEVDKLVYLALGGLRPAFDRLEFNLAEKWCYGRWGDERGVSKVGDLGELVEKISNQKFSNSQMTVNDVYVELEKIARDSGSGSQERKVMSLSKLLKGVEAQSANILCGW